MNKLLTLVLAASAAASFSVSAPAFAAGGFIDSALFSGMSGGSVFPANAGSGLSVSSARLNDDGSTSIVYSKGGKMYAEITGFYVDGAAPNVSSADPSFTGKDGGSESVMKSGTPSHELSVMFRKSGFCHDLGDSPAELTLVQKDGDALTCSIGGEDYVMAFRDIRDSKKTELGATAILLKLEPEANGDEFFYRLDQVSNVSSVWFTRTFTPEFSALAKDAREELTRHAALDAAGGLYLLASADSKRILNLLRNGSAWDGAKRDGKVVRKAYLSLVPDKSEAGQDKFSVDGSALAYTIEGDIGGENLTDTELAGRIAKDPICRGTVTDRAFTPHFGRIVSCSVPFSGENAYHYYIITLDQEARRFAVVRSTGDMNPNEVRGIIRDLTPRPAAPQVNKPGAAKKTAGDDGSLTGIIGRVVLLLILLGLIPGGLVVLNQMRAKKGLDKVSLSDLKRLAGGGHGHTKLTFNDLMNKNVSDSVSSNDDEPQADEGIKLNAGAASGKKKPDAPEAGSLPAPDEAEEKDTPAAQAPGAKESPQAKLSGFGEADIKKAAAGKADAGTAPKAAADGAVSAEAEAAQLEKIKKAAAGKADAGTAPKAAADGAVSAEAEAAQLEKIKKAATDAQSAKAEEKPAEQKKGAAGLRYNEEEDYKKKQSEKRKAREAEQGGKKEDAYTLKFNAGSNYKDKLIAEEEKAAKEKAAKKAKEAAEAGPAEKKPDAYTMKFTPGAGYKDKLIAEEEKSAKGKAAPAAPKSAPKIPGIHMPGEGAKAGAESPKPSSKMSWDSAAPSAPKSDPKIPGIHMPEGGAKAGAAAGAQKPSSKMSWDSAAPAAPKSAPNIPGIRMPGQGSTSAGTSKSAPNIPGIHMPGQGGKSASAGAPKSAPNIPGIRMPGQGSTSAGTSKSAPNIPGIHMPGQGGKSASAGAPKSAPNIPGIRMPGQGSTSVGTSKSAPNIPGIHMPGQGGKSVGTSKSAPNIPGIHMPGAPAGKPAAPQAAPAAKPQAAKVSSAMSWDSVPAQKKPAAAPAPKAAPGIAGTDSFVDIMKEICTVFSWNENGDISLPEELADDADRIVDTCRGGSSDETIVSICRFIRVMLADFAEDDSPLVQKLVKAAGVPESFVSAVSEADVVKATALGGPVRMFVSLCDGSGTDEEKTRQKTELLGSFILIALSHFASDPKFTSRDPLTEEEKKRAASEADTVRMLAYLGSSRAETALKAAGIAL